MDIPRTLAMNRYWAKHPPLHIMVASYFGFKSDAVDISSLSEEDNTEQALGSFAQMFSAAGGSVG